MEKTFIMIKPDGVERGLIGEIIGRIEKKGYKITKAKLITPDIDTVENHYVEHKDKPFFRKLVDFITSGKVMAMEVEGENVIQVMRLMVGDKDPKVALPGTIRGDFTNTTTKNIVHASDSEESAQRELEIWFN
ncbi:nucleoside-diphosphate kinase [Paratissierella segnis]|uniref:Nucleoside diphosphate kinase n=1 Tax=Paratissierella segnis TaxID=2763679 RepID=A0A926IKP3_9FIRM|nr:nucleoside-diphosphate kinase [Paratissierella segnis]MBC8587893.1 nucleoside-diphosphate kinase [Paratissierella segnis]